MASRISGLRPDDHSTLHAPGSASDTVIKALPKRPLTTTDRNATTGKAECSICVHEVPLGQDVAEFQCHHWLHFGSTNTTAATPDGGQGAGSRKPATAQSASSAAARYAKPENSVSSETPRTTKTSCSISMAADQSSWMHNRSRFWPHLKRSLLYAPIWRKRHNKEIQLSQAITIGTLPGRYHALLLVLSLGSNIAYTFVLDYHQNKYAIGASIRGRSGTLATINLIPTIVFALRNNPLIPLLDVSYNTFNLFHRYAARLVILESIIHSAAWAWNSYMVGGLDQLGISLATSTSYKWGMVATCVFTLMGFRTSTTRILRDFLARASYTSYDWTRWPLYPFSLGRLTAGSLCTTYLRPLELRVCVACRQNHSTQSAQGAWHNASYHKELTY